MTAVSVSEPARVYSSVTPYSLGVNFLQAGFNQDADESHIPQSDRHSCCPVASTDSTNPQAALHGRTEARRSTLDKQGSNRG